MSQHEKAFHGVVIVVRGETVDLSTFKLNIDDVSDGMTRIGSDIAWASALFATAQSEADMCDADYRNWRARFGRDITAADPKAAAWRVDQEIDGSDEFIAAKSRIAEAQRAATTLKGLVEGLKAKASSLQTKGGHMRAMMESEGMGAGGPPQRTTPPAKTDPKAAMRAVRRPAAARTSDEDPATDG